MRGNDLISVQYQRATLHRGRWKRQATALTMADRLKVRHRSKIRVHTWSGEVNVVLCRLRLHGRCVRKFRQFLYCHRQFGGPRWRCPLYSDKCPGISFWPKQTIYSNIRWGTLLGYLSVKFARYLYSCRVRPNRSLNRTLCGGPGLGFKSLAQVCHLALQPPIKSTS